jgi:hypothetical protein
MPAIVGGSLDALTEMSLSHDSHLAAKSDS